MYLTEQEVRMYRAALKSHKRPWLPLLIYFPVWLAWMVMVSFYDWPRLELPLATMILIIVVTSSVSIRLNRTTIKLLEKLGSAYPELSEKRDVPSLSAK